MSSQAMVPYQAPAAPRRRNRRRNNRGGANSEMSMLTGGTRDVKPQMLSFTVAESAADTTTTVTQPLPVLRNFQTNGGRAQLVEILKVYCEFLGNAGVLSATNGAHVEVALGTHNYGTVTQTMAAPDVFAFFSLCVNAAATGQTITQRVFTFDCTDGAGNGVLVATDNIFAQISGASAGNVQSVALKVLYRIAGASVIEYVGIVQGQQ